MQSEKAIGNGYHLQLMNGVLFVILFASAAYQLSQWHYISLLGISPLIVGIVLGMIYGNTLRLHLPVYWLPGILFSSKVLLRVAIVLYGFRLPCCALVGAVGWFVYELAVLYGADAAAASLIAVIPLTLVSRLFAILLKTPVTVFLLTGIFPLVPGAGIYYTAYYFIQGNNALALSNGISTFKVAVALAIGITLVLSVPIPKRHRKH